MPVHMLHVITMYVPSLCLKTVCVCVCEVLDGAGGN